MTTPSTYKLGYPPLKYAQLPVVTAESDPTSSDLFHPTVGGYYPLPTLWCNKATNSAWLLTSISSGTTANWQGLTDAATGNVVGPASSTNLALAKYDGTTGKIIQDSGVTLSAADVMTFPQEGGPVLTAGGTNPRKGQVTLVAGAATVATTAALADSVIALTIVSLGTVTDPMPMLVTIDPGVDFDITSEDATDTSTINWAIVG